MIDTHAHLTDPKFESEVGAVVARARTAGITQIINPTTNRDDAEAMLLLTEKYPEVYGLVGLYPGEAASVPNWERELENLWEILKKSPKVLGIGEIGLDSESYAANPEQEEKVFRRQLEMAREMGCPVVIHTRGTEEPMWRIIKEYASLPRMHFHCFSGSVAWLEYVLSRGGYVGFDGNVTYKSAGALRELAKRVPLERLLLETDAPYLPPEGKRGERNESANVRITAEFLAKLRGEELETLLEATTENARECYGIKAEL